MIAGVHFLRRRGQQCASQHDGKGLQPSVCGQQLGTAFMLARPCHSGAQCSKSRACWPLTHHCAGPQRAAARGRVRALQGGSRDAGPPPAAGAWLRCFCAQIAPAQMQRIRAAQIAAIIGRSKCACNALVCRSTRWVGAPRHPSPQGLRWVCVCMRSGVCTQWGV